MRRVLVVSAGTGTPSASRLLGERLAQAVVAELDGSANPVEIDTLELRTVAVDLAHHLGTRMPDAKLRAAFDQVAAADALIVVSPVMNGSYSGLFKMFFDALDEGSLRGRPVLLAATGGTARHSLAIDHGMLPMFYYLKALVAPHAVFAATKDWGAAGDKLGKRIHRAAVAFAELVRTAPPAAVADEFAVTDFSQLLGLD